MVEGYAAERGNANIPPSFVVDGFALGKKCTILRWLHHHGTLPAEIVERLEAIGFSWTPKLDARDEFLIAIERYAAEHGNANVPRLTGTTTELWRESEKVRWAHRQGKLPPDVVRRLEAIGFRWAPRPDAQDALATLIEEYAIQHGNADVPQPYVVNGIALGKRCVALRTAYQRGALPIELVKRLEAVDFRFQSDYRAVMLEQTIKLVEAYTRRYGNAAVPQRYVVDGVSLGRKCLSLRRAYQQGTLPDDVIKRLEALGFQWTPRNDTHEQIIALIEQYAAQSGNANVPLSYVVNGCALGKRCENLRMSYRRGKLPAETVMRLEAVGFRWEPRKEQFEHPLKLLELYAAEHGHADVPHWYSVGDYRLGARCCDLRRAYRKGKLSAETVGRLEAVGFRWALRSNPFQPVQSPEPCA